MAWSSALICILSLCPAASVVEFSVLSSADDGGEDGTESLETPNQTPIRFVHISAHNGPLEELLYMLRTRLGRTVEPTYCLRTWKGCSAGFPGKALCCADDQLHFPHKHTFLPGGSLFREGPGETNPGHHYANLRHFFDLFRDEPVMHANASLHRCTCCLMLHLVQLPVQTFTGADFFYCDYPAATCEYFMPFNRPMYPIRPPSAAAAAAAVLSLLALLTPGVSARRTASMHA
jgi:hypothetical protein